MADGIAIGGSWYLGKVLDILFNILKYLFAVVGELIKNRTFVIPWIITGQIPVYDSFEACYTFTNASLPPYWQNTCIPAQYVNNNDGFSVVEIPYIGTIIELLFGILAAFFIGMMISKIIGWVVKK